MLLYWYVSQFMRKRKYFQRPWSPHTLSFFVSNPLLSILYCWKIVSTKFNCTINLVASLRRNWRVHDIKRLGHDRESYSRDGSAKLRTRKRFQSWIQRAFQSKRKCRIDAYFWILEYGVLFSPWTKHSDESAEIRCIHKKSKAFNKIHNPEDWGTTEISYQRRASLEDD